MFTKCNFDCCDFAFLKPTTNPDECFVLWFRFCVVSLSLQNDSQALFFHLSTFGCLLAFLFFVFCFIKKPFSFLRRGATIVIYIYSIVIIGYYYFNDTDFFLANFHVSWSLKLGPVLPKNWNLYVILVQNFFIKHQNCWIEHITFFQTTA